MTAPVLAIAAIATAIVLLGWNLRLRRELTERRQIEQRLLDHRIQLADSQRMAHIGTFSIDLASGAIEWSDESFAIVGLDPARFQPTVERFFEHIHPDDRERVRTLLDDTVRSNGAAEIEYRIVRPNGQMRYIHTYGRVYPDAEGRPARVAGASHDITEHRRTELALRDKQHQLQSILDNAPIGIWLQNADGRLLFVNHAFCDAVGIPEERFLAVPHYAELYEPATAASCMASDAAALATAGPHVSYERLLFTDGNWHDLEIVKVRLTDESGALSGLIGLASDITERKRAEEQLRHKAYYDDLTGLPNRHMLMDRLQEALAHATTNGSRGALLFIDFDDFKIVNDSLGHAAGDTLLQQIAERTRSVPVAGGFVARMGGDEFGIVLEGLSADAETATREAEAAAEDIRARLAEPYLSLERELHITPSIGLSPFPLAAGETAEDVLKHADTAMYRAKEAGRNGIRVFSPRMQEAAEERLHLHNALRGALAREEFALHYQPQVDAQDRIIGAEALIRWQHPERGLIAPKQFIPQAETGPLILPIGEWVLRSACRQLHAWREHTGLLVTLSINVSPRQFHQPDFVDLVRRTIDETGIDPAQLELELTEGILIENVEEATSKMDRLRALGLRFAIDDFGTGYSSLSYLKRLPLDRIKIDQSFVRDITTDPNDALIVETIIGMCDNLGLEVIAEGVEDRDQHDFLLSLGCLGFQGYLFSPPLEEP
ncbi:MAG: EAL domain-containing protein, partial [Ectothiorhodospiraceae bacterium]|nr:EAL domain-containing protein [Ectothiorhodospiraceae bacterium]